MEGRERLRLRLTFPRTARAMIGILGSWDETEKEGEETWEVVYDDMALGWMVH
jgi:hypothetical protein